MAKTETDIATVESSNPHNLPAAPSFARGNKGLDLLKQVLRPSRLKITQPTTGGELAEKFAPGSIVMMPEEQLIVEPGVPFEFVPLFFFMEYCTWNPYKAGDLPTIRARSFEMDSDIARKASNPETWKEPCPEAPGKEIQHCEHLCFAVMIEKPFIPVPMLVTFVRMEHKTGGTLGSLIRMAQADIFAIRFAAYSKRRNNNSGVWFGLDVARADQPWVTDEARYNAYKAEYEALAKAYASRTLEVAYDDPNDAVTAPIANEAEANADTQGAKF